MKYLMYSESGEGAGILQRIKAEGNNTSLFIKDPIYKDVYKGILDPWDGKSNSSDEIVIFDISGNGKIAGQFKKQGTKIYGASSFADNLEFDRDLGFAQMVAYGIKVPTTKTFKTFAAGLQYIKNAGKDQRLVFKPNGSMPCKLTFVSKDNEELIEYLNFVEKVYGSKIDDFVLQDFIEGVVVSSEFFCDGKKFLRPCNHTVEVKKAMNDELGPSTGCSGNITWLCDGCKLCQEGVEKIEELCVSEGYVGQIDLNAVINDDGVFGLEWTPRMGYDATPTFLTLLDIEYSEFFSKIVEGTLRSIPASYDYAGAVRFSIPPYPVELLKGKDPEDFSESESVPILNWEKHQENIYFYEVRCEDGRLVHSSGTGVIGIAFDQARYPEECLVKPMKILEDIHLPDKGYRTDLGRVLSKMISELERYL
jgi:phosphoribosylamine--glycine ligase